MTNKRLLFILSTAISSTRFYFSDSHVLVSFQDYINKILNEKFDVFVIVYLNNILIYIEKTGQVYMKTVY